MSQMSTTKAYPCTKASVENRLENVKHGTK